MSKKWFFTFKNFQNVYWHGKRHSAIFVKQMLIVNFENFKIQLTGRKLILLGHSLWGIKIPWTNLSKSASFDHFFSFSYPYLCRCKDMIIISYGIQWQATPWSCQYTSVPRIIAHISHNRQCVLFGQFWLFFFAN